jgi:hypothetical protein
MSVRTLEFRSSAGEAHLFSPSTPSATDGPDRGLDSPFVSAELSSRHVPLSSHTRSAPAGFIEPPCLSMPADKPPSGANWIHEIKHDRYRAHSPPDPQRVTGLPGIR